MSPSLRRPRAGRLRSLTAGLAATSLVFTLTACQSGEPKAGTPKAGGTLRIGLASESGALNPHTFSANFLVLDGVFDALVGYGPNGKLQPELAESWTVAPDGKSVEFDLRDGVTFHDGTPFDAKAVKWNFDRWVGKKDFSFFRASKVITGVEVIDPDTVKLKLSEPYDPLLQELSIARPVRFLSPDSVGADGKFSAPVGTGPWKFVSNSATGAVLQRNDAYWGKKPLLDRLEFKVIPDSQSRLAALRNGELDVIGGAYLAPLTPVEAKSLSKGGGGARLLTGEPDVTAMLGFNPKGPAGDKAVREAVAKALDRKALIEALYLGYGEPASRFFPPAVPDSGADQTFTFDKAAAEKALDAAGYTRSGDTRSKDGKPLRLRFLVSANANGMQDARGSAEAVAGALKEVGIGTDIVFVDDTAYYEDKAAGKWDIAFFETYGAPYDPSSTAVAFLAEGAESPVFATGAYDRLVDAALFARDPKNRKAKYQALYDALYADAGYVPIAYRTRLWAVRDNVTGFSIPTTEYDLELNGVGLR
ncbi:ABC transporter substrate-binding protein [Streptomyces massasporeus]|uniref:ABC transporter substrate-binding protein n=1 Tax=Streptomyces massasporeus TaxID=67324 RepID=UPI0036FE1540